MKKYLSNFLILFVAFSSWAQPVVGPNLEELFLSKLDTEVTVIARFKSPLMKRIPGELPSEIQRRQMSRFSAIQQGVLSLGFGKAKSKDVKRMVGLWIENSVIITAKLSFIRGLLNYDEIQSVELDGEIMLFDPIEIKATEVDSRDSTYGLKVMQVQKVWEEMGIDGKGVVIGIMDTGVDSNHPSFGGRILQTKDFISDYADNVANDGQGHGSHCAGTILGGKDSKGRSIGVAPSAKLVMAKIFSDKGKTTNSAIFEAMQWMADPDGNPDTEDFPRVISNSWGGLMDDRHQEAIDTWEELGIIPIFAAGNSGPTPGTVSAPGGYKNVIAIGATDGSDEIANFSSRGPVDYQGETYIKPDVSAPGVKVYSVKNGGGFKALSGTSMATPHTAGVVGLMLQEDPHLSLEETREILSASAVDLGQPGKDNDFGEGRIDAFEALRLVRSGGKARLTVSAGTQKAKIQVNPGGREFHTNSEGMVRVFLPAGEYQLRISAFGYFAKTVVVVIKKGEILEAQTALEPSPSFQAGFQVKSPEGTLLDAEISFPNVPVVGGNTHGNVLTLAVPGGDYQIEVRSSGFRTKMAEVTIDSENIHTIQMAYLPPFFILDRTTRSKFKKYYKSSLSSLGLGFEIDKKIMAEDLMAYEHVIYFSGNNSKVTLLNLSERKMLTEYVKNGGRLIITGQEIGFRIRASDFYKEIIGANFVGDVSKEKRIEGSRLEFKLNGPDSANNQKWPDVIRINPKVRRTVKAFLHYKGKGPAGLISKVGKGKVAYLPFGFEGISGRRNRKALMKLMIKLVSPSTREELDRIHWSYQNQSDLYPVLIRRFRVSDQNRFEVGEILRNTKNKTAFQPILQSLRLSN
jgi:hypothetical protein